MKSLTQRGSATACTCHGKGVGNSRRSGSSLSHKIAQTSKPVWHVVDAKGQVLGRLATQVSTLLQGKHKPVYVPSVDVGDWVVIINARHVAMSGTKPTTKLYRWHTGHPGGLKTLTARHLMERAPERIVEEAVLGMLPKNRLKRGWAKKLRIFCDEAHDHAANVADTAKGTEEYRKRYAPVSTGLRPKPATGDLVVDWVDEPEELK